MSRIALLFLLSGLLSGSVAAQWDVPFYFKPPTDYSWISEPWNEDSTPYQTTAREVENFLARQNSDVEPFVRKMERSVEENSPAIDRLRLGVAYLWYQAHNPDRKRDDKILWRLRRCMFVMSNAPAPKSWYYAKIRFLVQQKAAPRIELIPLAKRLLEKNPADKQVEKEYIWLLSSGTTEQRKNATTRGEMYARDNADEPDSYRILGEAYWGMYAYSKDIRDLDKALGNYQEYLRRAEKNDPKYPRALQSVEVLKGLQKNPLR